MAATVANVENLGFAGAGGPWKYAEITLDSAYLPGGEVVNAADLGFKTLKAVFFAGSVGGYSLAGTLSTDKTQLTIKVYIGANATTSASVLVESNARDLSLIVIPCLIRGV